MPDITKDKQITLYAYATSPYAAKVAAVLHFKGLKFNTVDVDPLTKRELKFAQRRVVPTLRIGEEWRQDSTDLCLWIDQLFPEKSICGANAREREKILTIDTWISNHYMPAFFRELIHWEGSYRTWVEDRWRYGTALHHSRDIPGWARLAWPWAVQWTGFIRDHARQTNWKEPLETMRRRLLNELLDHLKDGPFLGGLTTPSLADLALFPNIATPYLIGLKRQELWIQSEPVKNWMKAVAKALPEHPFLINKKAFSRSLDTLA